MNLDIGPLYTYLVT